MPVELTEEDIGHFEEYGYVVVKEAFPPSVAASCREEIWCIVEHQGMLARNDPSTWPLSHKLPLATTFYPKDGSPWKEVFTSRLLSAIDDICGESRACEFGLGWWMVSFPNQVAGSQWKVEGSWHIDGSCKAQRYPYSKEVGLVPIMLFSDVFDDWGGTAIAEASHLAVAKQMVRACASKSSGTYTKAAVSAVFSDPANEAFEIIELTGRAGDVILCHPLLIHARSTNLACPPGCEKGVRFMCHPTVALKDHMRFDKPFSEMNALERSIVFAVEDNDILRHALPLLVPGSSFAENSDDHDELLTTGSGLESRVPFMDSDTAEIPSPKKQDCSDNLIVESVQKFDRWHYHSDNKRQKLDA